MIFWNTLERLIDPPILSCLHVYHVVLHIHGKPGTASHLGEQNEEESPGVSGISQPGEGDTHIHKDYGHCDFKSKIPLDYSTVNLSVFSAPCRLLLISWPIHPKFIETCPGQEWHERCPHSCSKFVMSMKWDILSEMALKMKGFVLPRQERLPLNILFVRLYLSIKGLKRVCSQSHIIKIELIKLGKEGKGITFDQSTGE